MTEYKVLNKAPHDDYIPGGDYVSPDFAALEKSRLWSRAWLMAGREEEVAEAGQFLTFNIADESVTVVRTAKGELRAFHNVCPHRGRRITTGCGKMGRFFCKYHGWNWNLEGKPVGVVDRDDWDGELTDEDISLVPVRVDTWSGWVFVCMDESTPGLMEYLGAVPGFIDCFDIGSMRYKWRRQCILPTNWKVSLEAFTEGYHVQTTHRQILDFSSDYTYSAKHGLHGMFGYAVGRPLGLPSPRLGEMPPVDVRAGILAFWQEMKNTLDTTLTDHTLRAAERLLAEADPDIEPAKAVGLFMQFNREEHEKAGAPWPKDLTFQQIGAAGTSWHVFPNMVFLQGAGQLLGYRARPNGDDPDSCIFDVYALERYAPGKEPKPELQINNDITDEAFWGLILTQDFQNMADIQQGMKSRGFKGCRPNPKQELAVSNFHAALHEFMA